MPIRYVKGIFYLLGALAAIYGIVTLITAVVQDAETRIIDTQESLLKYRHYISKYEKTNCYPPQTSDEFKQMVLSVIKSNGNNMPAEYILKSEGDGLICSPMDGKGGFYFNSFEGEIYVNLDKPLKHYLWFCPPSYRDEIPSEW